MSGTKPDTQVEAIKDPDVIEACKATVEDLDLVQLDNTDSTRKAYVGHNLSELGKYHEFLTNNADLFAFSHSDMPGIPRHIATHQLNVDPFYPPVRQMRRKFNAAINEAVSEEVDKLLANEFDECRLDQIPRAQNIEADGLAKLAAAIENINKENVVTLLHSVIDHVEVHSVSLTWDWHNRLVAYLQDGTLPQDKKEAKKLWIQAARYNLVNGDLYKRTFGGPLAKCLGPNQTRRVLEEIHEGHCGAHMGNRALVRCLIRAKYY
uniref:Uncharacterized protein LOC104234971 n=1 Tax=Nicotiana sylvestris TaxID=4096 RepID=A0A1U7XKB8_NICSY|nr:PREDICTED: uncharacterized protein LOC104234971 [Nicotiana sylvestris]